ncbi:MAG: YebC/PmpR family DNA-binding transcriptional regulator [bacterium]
MSGHSKWSKIKRAKGANDAKKGAIFTKLSKLITVAARNGGDPDMNFTLRIAIDKARAANMPKDNIDRAVKKGAGESGDGQIYELTYEGLGPDNSQFIVKCLTDNRNRTAANIRHLFGKFGGSLSQVAWNFDLKGVIMISIEAIKDVDWEELQLELIDLDIEDLIKEEEGITIYTQPKDLQKVNQFLESKGLVVESADIEYIAKEKKEAGASQEKIEKFIEALEEDEDVENYYTNIDI